MQGVRRSHSSCNVLQCLSAVPGDGVPHEVLPVVQQVNSEHEVFVPSLWVREALRFRSESTEVFTLERGSAESVR